MLFLSCWEPHENLSVSQRPGIAVKLTRTGLFPRPALR